MPKIHCFSFAMIDAKEEPVIDMRLPFPRTEHNIRILARAKMAYLKRLNLLQLQIETEFGGQLENEGDSLNYSLDWQVINKIEQEEEPYDEHREIDHLYYT